MILLDDVVQILYLTQFNRRASIGLNTFDGSGVSTTLVNGDLVGQAVLRGTPTYESSAIGLEKMLAAGA